MQKDKVGQLYDVEVYNGSNIIMVITVTAKDVEEASVKARHEFFNNIKAKVKRNYD